MRSYIIRRLIYMVPTLILISIISFVIIQLPPGDFVTHMITAMEADGGTVEQSQIDALRRTYGLDQPMPIQYFQWIRRIIVNRDFGYSFARRAPVWEVIAPRLFLTMVVSVCSLLFSWIIALPAGIYSAVKQYSITDYIFTVFGFLGLAIPNFLLALVLMYSAHRYLGMSVGGLFSEAYMGEPWSIGKVIDMAKHIWVPMIVVGTAGSAALLRITRANLLDELGKHYVETAKAKGLPTWKVIIKYPVRIALNPFFSSIGFLLPRMISGSIIVAVVLNLPTTGPVLLQALVSQDMYLAGSFILLLAFMTIIGVLISDLLLAWLDPRIRYD